MSKVHGKVSRRKVGQYVLMSPCELFFCQLSSFSPPVSHAAVYWTTFSPSNNKNMQSRTSTYWNLWPHNYILVQIFPPLGRHMNNVGLGTNVAKHLLIQNRSLYHHKTNWPPVWNLLGTVFSSRRARQLCSMIDTVGDVRRVERMTGLMGEAAGRVYCSLSAPIQSHGAEERRNTRKRMTEWGAKRMKGEGNRRKRKKSQEEADRSLKWWLRRTHCRSTHEYETVE